MAIGITLNLSNSSFPPLPPTPPLPFRAPLRPKTSLKEPAIPLPQTRSSPFPYHYNTSFPRFFFLHSLSFSPKTPHGRTQTRPHHAGSSASQTMPQPTPNRNPCHALHSPVSVPTSPWLSPPPLRLDMSELLINFWGVWAPVFGFFAGETGQKPAEFQRQPLYSAFPKSGDGRTKEDITSRAANCSLAQSRMTLAYFQKLSSLVASIMCA